MTSRMTATDELRRLLDGRGVEWEECRVPTLRSELAATFWYDRDGNSCSAVEGADDTPDGKLSVNANLTPEQAIEATLGSDLKAENEKLREQIETLVMYVEADGTRYWVDDDGNQHFDHSATVKDDADKLRELARHLYVCLSFCDREDEERGCGFCPYRSASENCEFEQRLLELGVEV